MADPNPDESSSAPSAETSLVGCFLSIFRIMVGPALLLVVGSILVLNKPKLGSAWDFVFLALLLATLGAALLAPAKPAATPARPGEVAPVSRSTYVTILLAAAATIFVFAHFVVPKVF